ncbi:hypothetical protein A3Q56_05714, partial [Intoshia linei]
MPINVFKRKNKEKTKILVPNENLICDKISHPISFDSQSVDPYKMMLLKHDTDLAKKFSNIVNMKDKTANSKTINTKAISKTPTLTRKKITDTRVDSCSEDRSRKHSYESMVSSHDSLLASSTVNQNHLLSKKQKKLLTPLKKFQNFKIVEKSKYKKPPLEKNISFKSSLVQMKEHSKSLGNICSDTFSEHLKNSQKFKSQIILPKLQQDKLLNDYQNCRKPFLKSYRFYPFHKHVNYNQGHVSFLKFKKKYLETKSIHEFNISKIIVNSRMT